MRRFLAAMLCVAATGCGGTTALPTAPSNMVAQTEGRWTPVLGGSTRTAGQVYDSQHGEWVRTGVLVYVSATITLRTKGIIEGSLEIQGLPFRSAPHHDSACAFGDFDDAASHHVWVSGIIGSNSNVVMLRHRDSPSVGMSPMSGDDVSDRTALEMACTYITAEPMRGLE